MNIAGIDFNSFQIDVVLLNENDNTATHHVYELGKHGDAFDRSRRIREAMPSRNWWLDNCFAIGIEDPRGAARNVDSILYRVQGGILACLPESLMVHPWKPGSWRKEIGVSNVGKEAPAGFARTWWDEMPMGASQDALDAYCLAWATRQRLVIREAA